MRASVLATQSVLRWCMLHIAATMQRGSPAHHSNRRTTATAAPQQLPHHSGSPAQRTATQQQQSTVAQHRADQISAVQHMPSQLERSSTQRRTEQRSAAERSGSGSRRRRRCGRCGLTTSRALTATTCTCRTRMGSETFGTHRGGIGRDVHACMCVHVCVCLCE